MMLNKRTYSVLVVAASVLLLVASCKTQPSGSPQKRILFKGEVTSIVDGRTFKFSKGGKIRTGVLWCVAIPPKEEKNARTRLSRLVGAPGTMEIVGEDPSGRCHVVIYTTLVSRRSDGSVVRSPGQHFNMDLILAGIAIPDDDAIIPNDYWELAERMYYLAYQAAPDDQ